MKKNTFPRSRGKIAAQDTPGYSQQRSISLFSIVHNTWQYIHTHSAAAVVATQKEQNWSEEERQRERQKDAAAGM